MKLSDPHALARDPIGRCVAGPSYVIWCAAPDLIGSIQWGTPDDRDVRDMIAIMDFIGSPALARTGRVLMDCRDIEHIDPDVMVGFVALARDWLPRWEPRIERQVVVVPDGLAGIMVAGPLPLLAPSYPFRFAATLDEALAFLDHPGARAAHSRASAVAAQARGATTFVARLRSALAADLVGATVERCAAALAVSPRTLQRELGRGETSFSDELRRARVAAASELIRLGTGKLAAIAARVGFGSSSRMNAALRRELGVAATELRARARR